RPARCADQHHSDPRPTAPRRLRQSQLHDHLPRSEAGARHLCRGRPRGETRAIHRDARGVMRAAAALAAWLALSASSDARTLVTRVDPLSVQDDDFARHRDPADWRGLTVSRIEFREERGAWRLWRIANVRHRRGPLWFVPHDNENAGFEAGLE